VQRRTAKAPTANLKRYHHPDMPDDEGAVRQGIAADDRELPEQQNGPHFDLPAHGRNQEDASTSHRFGLLLESGSLGCRKFNI
jgi:hypothetical protein